jgi:diguanylate cyclase (GGDEF)-like protein
MTLDDWQFLAGPAIALAAAIPIFVLAAGALHLRANRALRRERETQLALAASQRDLAALRAALDQVAFGMVLLDQERRAQFINRAFRRIWRLPDKVADSRLPFVKLMYHGRDSHAFVVPLHQLTAYVAEQMALIRTGDAQPLDLRLADGEVLRFRCTALPDGKRLLSYGNVSDLTHQADLLAELASIDGLTGLYNRRHFLHVANGEWERFKRYGRPLALLLVDIDKLKSVNDRYGHDTGDRVVKEVAEVLRNNTRASDIAARVDGEEFALLLPEATIESARLAAERFRRTVAERAIPVDGGSLAVTASIGLSPASPDVSSLAELMKQADFALHEAKRTGRNRICSFAPSMIDGANAKRASAA